MSQIKQSTAFVKTFLMVLSSDHVTAATGKTVAVNLGKAGAAGSAAAGTVAEIDSTNMPGWYKVSLTTADTGTLGELAFHCTASGCDPTDFSDQVVAFDPNAAGVTVTTNNDKAGYALASSEHTAISGTDVPTALTAQGYTPTRAGYLDTLNGIATAVTTAVWSAASRTLSAFGFTPSVTVSDKTGFSLASSEHTAIAADVLDAAATSHNAAGTIGSKINSAASAGDPWATSLPGSYAAGSAGYAVGHNLDAQVSAVPASVISAFRSAPLATSPTSGTFDEAMSGSRADALGKWDVSLDGSGNPTGIVLYAHDGTTPLHTLPITNTSGHTVRG